MTKLFLEKQTVHIALGELISYQLDGNEYIHQKGSPGWRNSDTEMFPIIGPTADANFRVHTPKGLAIQDQHGLLRELPYQIIEETATSAVFQKKYKANSEVDNSKYPEKSTEKHLKWPYDFKFQKRFELTENGLEINFIISGENGMPFMLGYHPAFNLVSEKPFVIANRKEISLTDVLAVGSRALQVENCNEIMLKDKNTIQIKTEGFGNFMLWTEVENMICIEPITFYPYAVAQDNLSKGFEFLHETNKIFKIHILVKK